jgi:hypothetical protein
MALSLLALQGEVVLVRQTDQPGIIAAVSSEFASQKLNISYMTVSRESKGTEAIMAIGVDSAPSAAVSGPGSDGLCAWLQSRLQLGAEWRHAGHSTVAVHQSLASLPAAFKPVRGSPLCCHGPVHVIHCRWLRLCPRSRACRR